MERDYWEIACSIGCIILAGTLALVGAIALGMIVYLMARGFITGH